MSKRRLLVTTFALRRTGLALPGTTGSHRPRPGTADIPSVRRCTLRGRLSVLALLIPIPACQDQAITSPFSTRAASELYITEAPLCQGMPAAIWAGMDPALLPAGAVLRPALEGAGGYIEGISAGDVIVGSMSRDSILAGTGADLVCSRSAGDVILGGLGEDRLFGGPGADLVFGEDGDDDSGGECSGEHDDGGCADDHDEGGCEDEEGGCSGEDDEGGCSGEDEEGGCSGEEEEGGCSHG